MFANAHVHVHVCVCVHVCQRVCVCVWVYGASGLSDRLICQRDYLRPARLHPSMASVSSSLLPPSHHVSLRALIPIIITPS